MIEERKVLDYAEKVLQLTKDSIIVRFRFFDASLAKIKLIPQVGSEEYRVIGSQFYYDPYRLLSDYKTEEAFPLRLLLHILFHSIFAHSRALISGKVVEEYWNMATDIAVENIILDMDIPEGSLLRDSEQKIILSRLKKWVPKLTAQKLYREFAVNGVSSDAREAYERLFAFDRHATGEAVKKEPKISLSDKDWERIAQRMKAELKSFSKDVTGGESILMNLAESIRKRYNYEDILSRFAVMNEEIRTNPDEFDYIYYTYGLNHYKNMPLIEPLEYVEEKKIREFVIAIDTSASVRGALVEQFLHRTYDILSRSKAFSEELQVHVIQCDSRVTEDIYIDSKEKLKEVATDFQIKGFGATDFRPVFEHVDTLIREEKIKRLKGLIYFTDGYGIYPDHGPKYDTLFVFSGQDDLRQPVPGWAMQVILEEEQ